MKTKNSCKSLIVNRKSLVKMFVLALTLNFSLFYLFNQTPDVLITNYNPTGIDTTLPGAECKFSFVHLTDIHIGTEIPDFGTPGYNDTLTGITDTGAVVIALRQSVKWINEHTDSLKIRFVIVTGDLADSDEKSELYKCKQILDSLIIPYIPLIGNHDVWPYTDSYSTEAPGPFGDSIFNIIFAQHFTSLANTFSGWDDGTRLTSIYDPDASYYNYFQNFSFEYGNYLFILGDFAPRTPAPFWQPGVGPDANIHDFTGGSWQWLKNKIINYPDKRYENILLFSHFPLTKDVASMIYSFSQAEYTTITDFLSTYRDNIGMWCAGHIHRDSEYGIQKWIPDSIIADGIETAGCYLNGSGNNFLNGHFRVIKVWDTIPELSYSNTQYYRLSYRDDPATTIVVGWSDLGTSINAQVYYGTTDYGTDYQSYPFSHGIDRTVNYKGLNHQFARLSVLTPNTVYYFVIHDDHGTSARMLFKTLPDNANTPITFISGGDSRTGIIGEFEYSQCRTRRQDANSLVAKIRPSFVTFSGDYVFSIPDIYIPSTNSDWADWLTDWQLTITPDGQLIPIIPAFGNHELTDDVYNMFDIPNNNTCYSLSVGGKLLRIYTLNTEIGCDTVQQNWLANDLQLHTGNTSEPYWKFVQYHYPFVPHAYYAPNTVMSACWASLFESYKVKLVAESHTHAIKYTWPVVTSTAAGSDHGFIRNDTTGIVYIGEGSWGAPMRDLYTYYLPDAAYNWTRNQEKIPGFNLVCVSKQTIEISTIKLDSVSNVGQVQLNAPPCTLPANIPVWNPSNGNVIIINNPDLSSDAFLHSLTPSAGLLSPVFDSLATVYFVQLPAGTTTVPMVSAVPHDPDATVQITQATDLYGTVAQQTATVLVTAEDGITTMLYSVQFSVLATGIKNSISGNTAVVYPNPAIGVFYFDFFNKKQSIEIKVYNALGRFIKSEKISTGRIYSLDLSSQEPGIYYVCIIKDTLSDVFKISVIK